jgi:hypothetical protein
MSKEQLLMAHMQQADAIMGIEGFELTERMKALDAAVLAGRATQAEVLAFVKLNATLAGARSVLQAMPENDPRYAVIEQRYEEQRDALRRMAIRMDGAVRVAFDL